MLDNVVRQLQELPEEYTNFYANQLVNKLKKKCCTEPRKNNRNKTDEMSF